MPARTRHCFAAVRGSARRRRAGRRCSCIPSLSHSEKKHHLAFWLRTLRASACGFSFVRSWRVSYYTVAPRTSKWGKQDGYESQEIAEVYRGSNDGQAGERVAFGNGGSGFAGADESAGKAAWRARDAPGRYRGGDGGAPAFEQLCGHRVGGLHRFPEFGKPGRNCDAEVAGKSRVPHVDGGWRRGLFGECVDR